MLRVRVCAAHMGGFLGPKFSKQGSLFRQIFLKHGWFFPEICLILSYLHRSLQLRSFYSCFMILCSAMPLVEMTERPKP